MFRFLHNVAGRLKDSSRIQSCGGVRLNVSFPLQCLDSCITLWRSLKGSIPIQS
jgi:hypothetical protein